MNPALRIVLLSLVPLAGCAGAKQAAVESAMYKIWNDGDLSVIDRAYEPELAWEIKRFVQENRDLYPDIEVSITDSVIKGNRYVTKWQVHGTHRDLDKPVTLDGVSVRKREGGVFVQEAMFYDMKSVYDQLGFRVIPPAGTGPYGSVDAAASRGEDGGTAGAEWPDDLDDAYREDAVKAAVDAAVADIDGAAVGGVDCGSFPCVASVSLKRGPNWSADTAKLGSGLGKTYPELWWQGGRAHLAGGQPTFFAVLAFLPDAIDGDAAAVLQQRMDDVTASVVRGAGD